MSQLASVLSTGDSIKIAFHPDQLISRITKCVKAIFDVIKAYPDVLSGVLALGVTAGAIGYVIWKNTSHQKFKVELAEARQKFPGLKLSELLREWADEQVLAYIKLRESSFGAEQAECSWEQSVNYIRGYVNEQINEAIYGFSRDPTRLILHPVDSLPTFSPVFSSIKDLCLGEERVPFYAISENIGDFTQLERLEISFGRMEALPKSIGNLKRLEKLCFLACYKLTGLPKSIGNLDNLETLDLRNCYELAELPESIGNLSNLKELNLRGCKKLIKLPDSLFQLSSDLSVLYDTSNQDLHEQIQEVINQPEYNGPSFNTCTRD